MDFTPPTQILPGLVVTPVTPYSLKTVNPIGAAAAVTNYPKLKLKAFLLGAAVLAAHRAA